MAEIRLMARNRTVAVSSILLPLALGAFYVVLFGTGDDPAEHAVGLALQIAVVLGMGVYVTVTQTVVARRHSGALKRMRTSGLSTAGCWWRRSPRAWRSRSSSSRSSR